MSQRKFDLAFNMDRNFLQQSYNMKFIDILEGSVSNMLPNYQFKGQKQHKYLTLKNAQNQSYCIKPQSKKISPQKAKIVELSEEELIDNNMFKISSFGKITQKSLIKSQDAIKHVLRECNRGIAQSKQGFRILQ